MKSRYAKELSQLSEVYDVARRIDISPLCSAVEAWMTGPMIMVGSGGSFSTATYAAHLHERMSGHLARSATPLEVASGPIPSAGVVCFSASGRNRDILSAFRAAARREVDRLGALILSNKSPLGELGSRIQYAHVIEIPHPTFTDGFLAVASLLASCLVLLRAYRAAERRQEKDIPDSLDALIDESTSFASIDSISPALDPVTARRYISVLHTQPLSVAAIDLESRFVEAALGALHRADLRNFGHGRHVWLAKRALETSVLALISEEQSALADKTLALLPESAASVRVDFRGAAEVQALAGLIVGLHAADSAGNHTAIDPGKPGVPTFGRALYRLSPNVHHVSQASINRAAAIRRKGHEGDEAWDKLHRQVIERFYHARFDALAADYDGTLCDTRSRFDPLPQRVAAELTRLCERGATVGIATGRGPSAGNELRDALPEAIHKCVLVGYYNCAEIRPLTDDSDPLLDDLAPTNPLLRALSSDPLFSGSEIRTNVAQISIMLNVKTCLNEAVRHAQTLLRDRNIMGDVVASSHSVDLLLKSQSKCDIVDSLNRRFGLHRSILRLGDKGRWPGNDADLLDDPFGLSVDEVSSHPDHCWALAPAGIKGVQATLYYLRRLQWSRLGGRLKLPRVVRA